MNIVISNYFFIIDYIEVYLQRYTGMDGFTVFGGKMIVTYSE